LRQRKGEVGVQATPGAPDGKTEGHEAKEAVGSESRGKLRTPGLLVAKARGGRKAALNSPFRGNGRGRKKMENPCPISTGKKRTTGGVFFRSHKKGKTERTKGVGDKKIPDPDLGIEWTKKN